MQKALQEARAAGERGDQPVGAALVQGDAVIVGSNRIASTGNPLLHAEVDVILKAITQEVPLPGATIYSTVESCHMCLGAILNSGITTLNYGVALREVHSSERVIQRYGDYSCANMLALLGKSETDLTLNPGVAREESLAIWNQYRDGSWNALLN
jgi:tRNA(Arg) A34 adenosine deaminase TadA